MIPFYGYSKTGKNFPFKIELKPKTKKLSLLAAISSTKINGF